MTKKKFIAFCKTLGLKCEYSGKHQMMYIYNSNPPIDIAIVSAQHFGIIPDFEITEVSYE